MLVGCGGGAEPAPEATPSAGAEAPGPSEATPPAAHLFEDCERREDGPGWLTCVVAVSLRQELPNEEIVEAAPLEIHVGEDHVVYLDNLLAQLARSADEQEAIGYIAQFLRGTLENLQPMEVEADRVRATLKPVGWARDQGARLGGEPLLSRPFGGGAEVVYVLDMPSSMRMLTPADLATLGLDEDGLHALALRNLRGALSMPTVEVSRGHGRIATLAVGDAYDAARLLLPDLWAAIARSTDGHLVVAAPVRDAVLMVDGRDADGVLALRALARRTFEAGPYEVSPELFRYTPEGFVPLDEADGP